eukprot:CAMPEP_0171987640 /NCGR_PEP_ID=MMETSP0993-20121228/275490_1 /TAXON_ID=483369 /ORGANISM="non described non described, Strain CCMP2098" /LENGTH=111 /DNA_ID=CAMNT_0012640587 /DNA_START=424 /DNA_END=755 /DNA_ORIENTATION=+
MRPTAVRAVTAARASALCPTQLRPRTCSSASAKGLARSLSECRPWTPPPRAGRGKAPVGEWPGSAPCTALSCLCCTSPSAECLARSVAAIHTEPPPPLTHHCHCPVKMKQA